MIIDDIFGIDEITLYKGEHSDKVYAVAGEVIDGVSNYILELVSLYEFYVNQRVEYKVAYSTALNINLWEMKIHSPNSDLFISDKVTA